MRLTDVELEREAGRLLRADLAAAPLLGVVGGQRPAQPLPSFFPGDRLVAGAAADADGAVLRGLRQALQAVGEPLRPLPADRPDDLAVPRRGDPGGVRQLRQGQRLYPTAAP